MEGISAKNANSLINETKVQKSDSVKIYAEWNLTFARFEEHVGDLQTLVNANV